MTIGIQVHPKKLRHQDPVTDLEGGPQQVAQPAVLGLQGIELLHAALKQQIISMQGRVLLAQLGLGCQAGTDLAAQIRRQIGCIKQRVHHHRQGRAQGIQMAKAVVRDDQPERQHQRQKQARGGRRTLDEQGLDGRGLVFGKGLGPQTGPARKVAVPSPSPPRGARFRLQ